MILLDIFKPKRQLRRRVRHLEAVLRATRCPYPLRGEPWDQEAGTCCDKKQCGCHIGHVLGYGTSDRRRT